MLISVLLLGVSTAISWCYYGERCAHFLFGALAVAPLASGRLDPPDIALFYATPGAMIYFINGLQYSGYKRFDWSVVGESACADSWGRALRTREPSLSIPCFAERRFLSIDGLRYWGALAVLQPVPHGPGRAVPQ